MTEPQQPGPALSHGHLQGLQAMPGIPALPVLSRSTSPGPGLAPGPGRPRPRAARPRSSSPPLPGPVPGAQPAPGSSAFLRKPLLTAGTLPPSTKRATDTHTKKSPVRAAAPVPGSGCQLIHVLLPPAAQVLLDDLGKQVPLQQRVSQGQQLPHRLVEVLRERRETRAALGLSAFVYSGSSPSSSWLCPFEPLPKQLNTSSLILHLGQRQQQGHAGRERTRVLAG